MLTRDDERPAPDPRGQMAAIFEQRRQRPTALAPAASPATGSLGDRIAALERELADRERAIADRERRLAPRLVPRENATDRPPMCHLLAVALTTDPGADGIAGGFADQLVLGARCPHCGRGLVVAAAGGGTATELIWVLRAAVRCLHRAA